MDTVHTQYCERLYPPVSRSASRSSTSTSNTRFTARTVNSAPPQYSRSQLSNPHAQRLQSVSSVKSTGSPRATTPQSIASPHSEAGTESTRQPAVSSFLQDKLQRERQAESERASSMTRKSHKISASLDFGRRTLSSPVKEREFNGNRPHSSSGIERPKKKNLGVKEMEQVISTLHKQNFDLKLELFHRRDRQAKMEEHLESLENAKVQVEEINDKLLEELEKRDKAVEEAVAMIVMLEAKLEKLNEERPMSPRFESEGSYNLYNESTYDGAAPQPWATEQETNAEPKTISRMPSFLTENTENAENLRNVYLGIKGSVISLPPLVEGPGGLDSGTAGGIGSPCLSILSESSFTSVYGNKEQTPSKPQRADQPLSLDHKSQDKPAETEAISRPQTSMARTQSMPRTTKPSTVTVGRIQHQAIKNVVKDSPLQRIERTLSQRSADIRTPTQGGNASSPRPIPTSSTWSSGQKTAKEEKRESLRKVVTDASGGVRLHDQALPPTPDTISTSTLRRFQNSDEALSRKHGPARRLSFDSMSDHTVHDGSNDMTSGARLDESFLQKHESSQRHVSWNSYTDSEPPAIQRSPPAGRNTIQPAQGNDWESDSDEEFDNRSLESNLDIWVRENAQSHTKNKANPSDLFSFPAGSKHGWAIEAMVAADIPHDRSRRLSTGIDPDRIFDLFPVQEALFGNSSAPPPPPNRRSSLNAQTGISSRTSSMKQSAKASLPNTPDIRNRSSRRDSDVAQMRKELSTPVQQSQQAQEQLDSEQKRSHYPPIAGQQGARHGLNRLFRRSVGAASLGNASPITIPNKGEEESLQLPQRSVSAMGAPSWVQRSGVLDDDRDSATPPPIMRSPRRPGPVQVDAPLPKNSEQDPHTPTTSMAQSENMTPNDRYTPQSNTPRASSAMSHRRKWLPGFGLGSSLRSRHN